MKTVSLDDDNVNFICSTEGGSIPAINLVFNWHDRDNINKKITSDMKVL